QMEGFAGGMKALTSALEGLVLAIADSGLLEWATQLAERLTGFVQRLSETNPEMLRLGVIIAGVAAIIGPLLIVLGMMVNGLGVVAGIAGTVAGAIAAISLPVLAVIAAIALLVVLAVRYWDEIKAAISVAVEFIKGVVRQG